MTGRWVDAQEAREIGLATIVVPPDDLEAATSDLAEALTAPPREAVTATKALLRTATGRSYTDQLAAERMSQVRRLRALVDALAAGLRGSPGTKGAEQVFCTDDG